MLHTIATFGSIAGVVVGLLMFVSVQAIRGTPAEAHGVAIGYLTMLIALSTIFVAVKRRRDHELGGVIRFWPAFGLGLGISVVAGIFYVLAWEITLATMSGDFMAEMIAGAIARQRADGASEAQIASFTAQMQAFARDYANPLYRMPITFTEIFPVGVLVSLVTAALLRNSRFLPARAPIAG